MEEVLAEELDWERDFPQGWRSKPSPCSGALFLASLQSAPEWAHLVWRQVMQG